MDLDLTGLDLGTLSHESVSYPATVPGRTVHIDGDFVAYEIAADRKDEPERTFDDIKLSGETRIENIRKLAGAEHVYIHLTPSTSNKGNRFRIAALKEYQGNRKDKEKPKYLNVTRQWLAQRFPGTLWQDAEADDGMAEAQYKAIAAGNVELSIIASGDKDLRMIPGYHSDWKGGGITKVEGFGHTEIVETNSGTKKLTGFGHKWFWAQMLTGDTADNISGLPKIPGSIMNRLKPTAQVQKALDVIDGLARGQTKTEAEVLRAQKVLSGRPPGAVGPVTADLVLSRLDSNKAALGAVKALYRAYGEEVGFTDWRTGEAIPWGWAFLSEAKLLWMRRTATDEDDVLHWMAGVVNGTED